MAGSGRISRGEIGKCFREEVGGILLCGLLVYLTQDPMVFGYRWMSKSVPNPDIKEAAAHMTFLSELIRNGRLTAEAFAGLDGGI